MRPAATATASISCFLHFLHFFLFILIRRQPLGMLPLFFHVSGGPTNITLTIPIG